MKIKGLVGVLVLSAGFVPALHSKKVETQVFMQDPNAKLTYFIETNTANEPENWPALTQGKTIKYDDSNSIKNLRVKRPEESRQQAQSVPLLDKAGQANKVIVVSESGLGYWTKDAWKTYKDSHGKSRSRL